MQRRFEHPLVELQIKPALELEAGVTNCTAQLETHLAVQRDARLIVRVDATNQGVIVLVPGSTDQLHQHSLADPPTAMSTLDVDRVLDGVLVGRPVAERSVGTEAQ